MARCHDFQSTDNFCGKRNEDMGRCAGAVVYDVARPPSAVFERSSKAFAAKTLPPSSEHSRGRLCHIRLLHGSKLTPRPPLPCVPEYWSFPSFPGFQYRERRKLLRRRGTISGATDRWLRSPAALVMLHHHVVSLRPCSGNRDEGKRRRLRTPASRRPMERKQGA